MNFEKIKSLWPIIITPLIDGVEIAYDTLKRSFAFNNETFYLDLGRKTYGPIKGYLIITPIDLEKINYKRAQSHLELFRNIQEAVHYILNTKTNLNTLLFVAQGILSNSKTLIEESSLLKCRGYDTISYYKPQTFEESIEFLTYFSTLQTQQERNKCFKTKAPIVFDRVKITSASGHFIFNNENLAVTPQHLQTHLSSDNNGNILAYYTFNPITILNTTFHTYKDFYFKGQLKSFTLINQKPKALYDASKALLEKCPTCSKKLKENRCINPYCKSKIVHKAYQIASREALNIHGLSKNTLNLIYDYLHDFVKIPEERIHELYFFYLNLASIQKLNIKEPQTKLLNQAIWQAAEKQKLSTLIYSLNIPEINKQQAHAISELYNHNIDDLIDAIEKGDKSLIQFVPKLETLKLFKSYIYKID